MTWQEGEQLDPLRIHVRLMFFYLVFMSKMAINLNIICSFVKAINQS